MVDAVSNVLSADNLLILPSHCSVCILSIIRLYSLQSFGLTADPTWDNVPTTFWSCLETTAAVVCACLPTIRAGFNRLCPKIWESTSRVWSPKPSETMVTSATVMFGYMGSVNRPSDKEWPAHELSSMSTLGKIDEGAAVEGAGEDLPPGSIKIVIQRRPDLMKPLPKISRRQDPHRSLGGFSMASELWQYNMHILNGVTGCSEFVGLRRELGGRFGGM